MPLWSDSQRPSRSSVRDGWGLGGRGHLVLRPLEPHAEWLPWLRTVIVIAGLVVAVGLVVIPLFHRRLLVWGLVGCAIAMAGSSRLYPPDCGHDP